MAKPWPKRMLKKRLKMRLKRSRLKKIMGSIKRDRTSQQTEVTLIRSQFRPIMGKLQLQMGNDDIIL